MRNLHSGLKTTVIGDASNGGINYKQVRIQNGKEDLIETIHAQPTQFSMSGGLQTTDFLATLGFSRAACSFHVGGQCYCAEMPPGKNIKDISSVIDAAFQKYSQASQHLEACGVSLPRTEGMDFFMPGSRGGGLSFGSGHSYSYGDGHVAQKITQLKNSEDQFFKFVFTWIEGDSGKGWTTHIRAKHMPLSPEFQAGLDFLGGFSNFNECPEFDFESCWWRFIPFKMSSNGYTPDFQFNDFVHRIFDSLAHHFSPGLQLLLESHVLLEQHGFSFLKIPSPSQQRSSPDKKPKVVMTNPKPILKTPSKSEFLYDVAISYASSEKGFAENLANKTREAGFEVFYDGFYQEQLWGKDLAVFFDRVYRKDARFCVMFVSKEYAERMWTTHERRSAQARMVQEKGNEYILPVKVDDTDLEGMPPTVGYISLKEYPIEKITEMLLKKLKK